jgi:triosephosphate isomerase
MKHIFVNFKRFDVPKELGGVNSLAPIHVWAKTIVEGVSEGLEQYKGIDAEFAMYFPEAHLLSAVAANKEDSVLNIGSQGIYRGDTAVGGNFGAFTTNLTGNAASSMGCTTTIIGHCEERKDKADVLAEACVVDSAAVNRLLNKSVICAMEAGMTVLYCIGEKSEEQDRWQEVLKEQIEIGLEGVDKSKVCIAYEPVWAIGPGKTPPNKAYITKIARYVKEITGGIDVVYGGGLKQDNAGMLASIEEIDGGLIALTRFTGDIGFYPEEYLEIVDIYMKSL